MVLRLNSRNAMNGMQPVRVTSGIVFTFKNPLSVVGNGQLPIVCRLGVMKNVAYLILLLVTALCDAATGRVVFL